MLAALILIAGMNIEADMQLAMGPKACAIQRDTIFSQAHEANDGRSDTRHYERDCNDDRICRYTPTAKTEDNQGAHHD